MNRVVIAGSYASLLALLGLGLSSCLRMGRFLNFGLGVSFLVGAYAVIDILHVISGVPSSLGVPAGLIVAALLGGVVARLLWQAHAAIGVDSHPPDHHFVLSFFALFAAQATLDASHGGGILLPPAESDTAFSRTAGQWGPGVLLMVVVVVLIALRRTSWGLRWLAVADSPELATLQGIDTAAFRARTAALAGCALGLVGGLNALNTGVQPYGNTFLTASMGALLGGVYSLPAVVAGCFLLSAARQVTFAFGLYRWEATFGALLFLLVLLVSPRGLVPPKARPGDRIWA